MLLAVSRRLIRKSPEVAEAKLFAHPRWSVRRSVPFQHPIWRWSDVTGSPKRRGLVSAQESVPWRKNVRRLGPFSTLFGTFVVLTAFTFYSNSAEAAQVTSQSPK